MDTTVGVLNHTKRVNQLLIIIASHLLERATRHDASKLEEPEKSFFDEHASLLASLKYGSDEYKQALQDLAPALEHHYQNNSHHPEHWNNGVSGMDLIDLCEMFVDWVASTERVKDGDIIQSILINEKRFKIASQISSIFSNTAERLGWLK